MSGRFRQLSFVRRSPYLSPRLYNAPFSKIRLLAVECSSTSAGNLAGERNVNKPPRVSIRVIGSTVPGPGSPEKFKADLNHSARIRAEDLTKRRVRHRIVRIIEVDLVKDVKELAA
jgi:hypothetical protein